MNARDALADLVDVSPGLQAAVAFDASGRVAGSTLDDQEGADAVAASARRLLDEASALRESSRADEVAAVTRAGALVVAAQGELAVAAVTEPDTPVPLALYDLRTCLRRLAEDAEAPLGRDQDGNGGGAGG